MTGGGPENWRRDPCEGKIRAALLRAGIPFTTELDEQNKGLDFYLPAQKLHIEVKQFHTPRIAKQMARADNVIAIQGMDAVKAFSRMIDALGKKERNVDTATKRNDIDGRK